MELARSEVLHSRQYFAPIHMHQLTPTECRKVLELLIFITKMQNFDNMSTQGDKTTILTQKVPSMEELRQKIKFLKQKVTHQSKFTTNHEIS